MSGKIIEVDDEYRLPEDVFEAVHEAMNEDVGNRYPVKVLADPTHLRILKAFEVQSLCVCALVECTKQEHPALSYHLSC